MTTVDAGAPPPERPVATLIREHSGLALTLLYLALIAIGMMYEWWLFRRFRIDILLYAQPADFLLVPFREPLVVLIAVAPIPIYRAYLGGARWLGKQLAKKTKAKEPDPRTAAFARKFMFGMNLLAMSLWSFVFTAEYAEWVWKRIRAGTQRTVMVEMMGAAKLQGTVVGTTAQFVFLHEVKTNLTRVIPAENIASIVVEGKKDPAPKPTAAR
ncbi:MAG TPA: hypothetical protein VF266_00030 [Thermoanaerobaculia bacterium]